jgi:uncharacterized protein (DUF302 family)
MKYTPGNIWCNLDNNSVTIERDKENDKMTKTIADYAFRTRLDLPYEQAVERVTAALKDEGFGIDFRKYIILGACNPPLAHQALNTELEIGLLLPCNVVVYEEDGGSMVSIVDPISMLGVVESPGLDPVAGEAWTRLGRVVDALSG